MSDKTINVAEDFNLYPFARYKNQSDSSGEEFRDNILVPALKSFDKVKVILDGTEGYGSSWFDESFAGIVRKGILSKEDLLKKLDLVSEEDPSYINEIKKYISEASRTE
jgi:hypothetical protein